MSFDRCEPRRGPSILGRRAAESANRLGSMLGLRVADGWLIFFFRAPQNGWFAIWSPFETTKQEDTPKKDRPRLEWSLEWAGVYLGLVIWFWSYVIGGYESPPK